MIVDPYEKENKILELGLRKRIYELVRKFAGCHFREIERKSKLATGTVKYHLNYLVKNELLSEVKEGNTVRYFPKGFKFDRKLLSFLRQKSIRRILLFILSNDNCNHEQIVKSVGLSPSTVTWHLKKLEQGKIIESFRKGRKTHFKLVIKKEEIVNILIVYRESFLDSLVNNVIEMWEVR